MGGPNFPFQSAGCGIAAASRPPQNGFQRGNETKRTNPLPAPQLNRPIGGGLFRPPPPPKKWPLDGKHFPPHPGAQKKKKNKPPPRTPKKKTNRGGPFSPPPPPSTEIPAEHHFAQQTERAQRSSDPRLPAGAHRPPPPPAMRSRWIFFSDFSWPLCRLQLSSVKQCPNLPGLVRGSCPKSRTVRIGRTGRFESSGTPTPPRSGIEPVLTGPFLPIKPGRRSNRCWRKPESPESPT